ncbi:hypothetical protein [Asticcacaulis solisilvae]|uniref:hypothetical protein n=1 Tax=Asticcacaulis solisilvae TaxID=1217274 RepID=UPI003FD6ED1E
MLSMTDTDTTVSFATPDDVRQASEKAFHIWLGAFSPLWAPFMAATATGLGFWSMSQAMKNSLGFTALEPLGPGTHLFAKWPGFALPFATPWSKGWGEVAEEADRIAELTHDSFSAPMQIAFEAEEKLEEAIEEAIATAQHSVDVLTPRAGDLFPVAETANRAAAEAVTKTAATTVETVETVADANANLAEDVASTAELASDTAAEGAETTANTVTEQTEKAAEALAESPRAVIDPVSETPVVPAVAEEIAEKLPLPLADISPALAPRRPRKPRA